jgi:hypothetical protein
MFGAVYAVDEGAADVLIDVAREFSPRIEIDGLPVRVTTRPKISAFAARPLT